MPSSTSDFTNEQSNCKRTCILQWNVNVTICDDLPETIALELCRACLPAVSLLRSTHTEAPRDYLTIVNDIQPCPKRWLLMQLSRVGKRTESTTGTATAREVAQSSKFIMALPHRGWHTHNTHKQKNYD